MDEAVRFAIWFCGERVETFDKDLAICLREDNQGRHAYMPALITCVGLLELFSCLTIGNLDAKGNDRIQNFVGRFMNTYDYPSSVIKVLWGMFRNKIAHLGRPYGVQRFDDQLGRLITWEIDESGTVPAIEIRDEIGSINDSRKPTWLAGRYTHRCVVHLKTLGNDIREAVIGPTGYVNQIQTDAGLRDNFKKCMNKFFQS